MLLTIIIILFLLIININISFKKISLYRKRLVQAKKDKLKKKMQKKSQKALLLNADGYLFFF